MSKIPRTVCPFCNLGCELGFEVNGRDIRGVDYVSDSRNEGRLCAKGNAAAEIANHRKRLYHPVIKGKQTSLAEAIEYLRQRLTDFKPEEVLVVYDASLTCEEVDLLAAWTHGAGYENLAYVTFGPESAFLYGKLPATSVEKITTGEYAFIVGDAFGQDSVISGYIAKAKGDNREFRYIVVDAFETNTSHFAHRFVQVRPGYEGLFLYGLYKHIASDKVNLDSIAEVCGVEASSFEAVASMIRNKDGILVNAPARGRSFDPFLTHAASLKLSQTLEQMRYLPLGHRVPGRVRSSFYSYLPMLMGGRIKAVVSFGAYFPWNHPQLKPVLRKAEFVAAGALFIPDGRFELELVLPMAAEIEKQGSILTLFGEAKLTGELPALSGSLPAGEYIKRLGGPMKPVEFRVGNHEALDEAAIDERAEAFLSYKAKRRRGREYLLLGTQSAIGFLSIFEEEDWVKLSPEDASSLGVKDKEEVGIETEQGEAGLSTRIRRGIPSGVAVVSMNHQPSLALFELGTDSATGEGLLKPSWSRIWKK